MFTLRQILAMLCSLAIAMGATASVQGKARASSFQTRKHSNRARQKRRALLPQSVPQIPTAVDEYKEKQILKGVILDVEKDRFTVRDERGLDTIVILFSDTAYDIETPDGARTRGDAKMLAPGLKVVVDGLLNSSYLLKAVVIRVKH